VNLDRRSVQRAIRRWEARGVLKKLRGGGRLRGSRAGRSSEYQIIFRLPAEATNSVDHAAADQRVRHQRLAVQECQSTSAIASGAADSNCPRPSRAPVAAQLEAKFCRLEDFALVGLDRLEEGQTANPLLKTGTPRIFPTAVTDGPLAATCDGEKRTGNPGAQPWLDVRPLIVAAHREHKRSQTRSMSASSAWSPAPTSRCSPAPRPRTANTGPVGSAKTAVPSGAGNPTVNPGVEAAP
jgi:hypothetical protein